MNQQVRRFERTRATDNPNRPGARLLVAVGKAHVPPCAEVRRAAIARAAYMLAEQRGFGPGHELADWLAAEADYERNHQGDHFCGD